MRAVRGTGNAVSADPLADDAVAVAGRMPSDAGTPLSDAEHAFERAARVGRQTAHSSSSARKAEHALVRVTEADDTRRVLRRVRIVSRTDNTGETGSRRIRVGMFGPADD